MTDRVDVLIVGAGLAGLFLALRLAPRRCRVICPAPIGTAASSAWAQGGLAAALGPQDSPESHAQDTLIAGDGLVDPVTARLIAEAGPERVRDLLEMGVPFDKTPNGALALSLEAAHSHPRVARVAGDLAGKAIMEALSAAVLQASHIEISNGLRAIELLKDEHGRVAGVLAEDTDGEQIALPADETVFCTGGSGGLFSVTTNPKEARGDAIAMAYRAGALLSDLEFVQFHPTAIDIGRDPAPLATEALRGEGARLVNRDGTPFMPKYDPAGELAPRDRVARAVHKEWLSPNGAFLDAREAVGSHFIDHFPTVYATCQSAGIDPVTQIIPIAPAAHYHMGGIVTDIWGRTSLAGLSACGECSSTGAHGANRLASNSLLEAVVFSARIADRLRDSDIPAAGSITPYTPPASLSSDNMQLLRRAMSKDCGVVRNRDGLTSLSKRLGEMSSMHFTPQTEPAPVTVAKLIVACALEREESRGGHFREDFPDHAATARRTFLYKGANAAPVFQTGFEIA
ncbi:L-aspartate oxidase [Ponticaulis profundi]|uniref:L-aspartate oxidase n=1 Tax=Ponticaulis profundi TaxID=2665222 RepID=A0ABW1S7U5_9PROT